MTDVRFQTEGLLSKWGFGDGDMLEDLLEDAGYGDTWKVDLDFDHRVLCRVVREFVVPAVEQHHKIEVFEIGTIHNPIRARIVDGQEIDHFDLDSVVALTPEYVDVPLAAVLAIATECAHIDGKVLPATSDGLVAPGADSAT